MLNMGRGIRGYNSASEIFLFAAQKGYFPAAEFMLKDENLYPNIVDRDKNTALIWSVYNGHKQMVELLLSDRRVDPSIINEYGDTALILSAFMGSYSDTFGDDRVDIVKLLLSDERVKINHSNQLGDTALTLSIKRGNRKVVKILLSDERVDPNIVDQHGNTALTLSLKKGDREVVELILAHVLTIRTHPYELGQYESELVQVYQEALRSVKRSRNARFRGLVSATIVFLRMRLRAAQVVYAPGGTGFATAFLSFQSIDRQSANP